MKLTYSRKLFFGLSLITASIYPGTFVSAATRTWNKAAAGTFSFTDLANWDNGATAIPNAIDDVAALDTLDFTGTETITLNQSITLGELRWADTVAASGTSFAPNVYRENLISVWE